MNPAPLLATRRSPGTALALLLGFSLLLGACGGSAGAGLSIGDSAPDFTLPTSQGSTASLASYQGVQPVLLYFHMAMG